MRRVSVIAAALAVAALGPLWNLATGTVTVPDRWAPWVWAVAVSLGVVAVVVQLSGPPAGPTGRIGPDEAADQLATAVGAQWRREEERRRVHDPLPVPVRWRDAPPTLVDHPANYRLAPAGVTPGPLELAGRLEQIGSVYRRIPSGRLVVLGRTGSGKTVLAARLLLDLLATRGAADPVPVVFSLGSWDPTTAPLRDWLADRLIRDHPGLAAPARNGGTLAAALVEADRVLPVLDGFDEIAVGLHRAALEALNATRLPLVLTSRPAEYAAAVAGSTVLTSAAGVELTDLTLTDLVDYLPRTTRRTTGGTSVWDPVLAALREHPRGVPGANLAAVLATPLMVALARAVYGDTPDHDPRELLDTDRFPTREAVEDHLLASFVPAVYRSRPDDHRRWDPVRVRRWLGHLAQHLHRLDPGHPGGDLAWWQLGDTVRRSSRMLAVGVTAGLVIGLVDWFAMSLVLRFLVTAEGGARAWLTLGLVDGLLAGTMAGLVLGLAHGLLTTFGGAAFEPSRVRIRILGGTGAGRRRLLHRLRAGLVGGLSYGLAAGFVAGAVVRPAFGLAGGGLTDRLHTGLVAALFWALVYGPAAGLVGGLMAWFEAPIDIRSTASPSELLRTNRRNVLAQLLLFGPLFGFLVVLCLRGFAGLLHGLVGPLVFVPESVLVSGLVVAFGGGLGVVLTLTAWGRWVVLVRVWLPLTGRLPWALPAFLDDAHRRGVLRQAGAVHQFRHARLRDHLAGEARRGPG